MRYNHIHKNALLSRFQFSSTRISQLRNKIVGLPDSGQSHQTPPERVEEGPGAGGIVLLGKVDKTGECEHSHPDQEHQQAQLFVSLVEPYIIACKHSAFSKIWL